MYPLSRRLWLKQTSAVLAGLACQPRLVNALPNEEIILGGGRFQTQAGGPTQFTLAKVRPQRQLIERIATPFFPHGLAFVPNHSELVFAFEKIGGGAALIDLQKLQVVKFIPPVKERRFYGHGACQQKLQVVFSTETQPDGTGVIGVRDLKTHQYLGDFPSYGANPHDCHLIEQGQVLAVTNGGGPQFSQERACLTFIDVASQRLLEKQVMPDTAFNTGHLTPFGQRGAIVISAPRTGLGNESLGAISVRQPRHPLTPITQPEAVVKNMFGEALSVVLVPKQNLFVVTHPTPGMVTFWQLDTQQLKKRIDLPAARGLLLGQDERSVWISYGPNAELARVDLATFELQLSDHMSATYLTGSHLYRGFI